MNEADEVQPASRLLHPLPSLPLEKVVPPAKW